jgi:hypothetical protein
MRALPHRVGSVARVPAVFVLGADRLDADALAIELDGVGRNRCRDDGAEVCADRVERAVAAPQ